MKPELVEFMTTKRQGIPINLIEIDDRYIIGIYQGQLSEFDFRVAYRENKNNSWTKVRQPKHIHWGVDLLMKQMSNPELTNKFIQYMLDLWDTSKGIKSNNERRYLVDTINFDDIKQFMELNFGAYSIKFIYTVMKLLMIQEKTNNPKAFMFQSILKDLLDGKDLYGIIGTATFAGK